MDKVQRVRAALEGDAVDRVPFCLFYHFRKDQVAGGAMARAHIGFYRAADPDFLKVMNDNGYAPPGLRGLKTARDWRSLRPAPLSSKCFQDQLAGLKKIVETAGDEVLVVATVFNPFHDADVISDWTLSRQLKEHPEAADEGMSTIAESLSHLAVACIQVGAAGIYFAAHGGGRSRHTSKEFGRFIRPHDLTVLRAAKNAGATFNILHVCGKELRLQAYAEYPSHAVNWAPQSANLSLQDGARLFKRTIIGGLDQEGPLLNGTRRAVTDEVVRAVEEHGRRSFILGAGCALTRRVHPHRVRWVRDALETATA